MTKRITVALVAAAALLAAPTALAMPVDGITGTAYNRTATCPPGKQIVYVTQNITNSADRGQFGSVWAIDNYKRVISLIQITPTTFCAATTYISGSFTTTGGPSPGGTRPYLSQGIQGTMGAGYRTNVFVGVLRPFPLAQTSGSFSVDYACNADGYCPGYVDWTTLYFTSVIG